MVDRLSLISSLVSICDINWYVALKGAVYKQQLGRRESSEFGEPWSKADVGKVIAWVLPTSGSIAAARGKKKVGESEWIL